MAASNAQATYVLGYEPSFLRMLRMRSARVHAQHLLPHLKPGMQVLDAGCGPGSISVGLAEVVGPGGTVTGVDFEPSQVDEASAAARDAGVTNARFQQADVTALPFPDETFDAVHMCALMCHVPDHRTALRELFRVLKPGGVVATLDPVFSKTIWLPEDPVAVESIYLVGKSMDSCGADGDFGLRSAEALDEAGFVRLAIATGDGPTPRQTPEQLNAMADGLADSDHIKVALRNGLVTPERLQDIVAALRAASRKPFYHSSIPHVSVVGWKP